MSYILDALNKSEQERQQRDHGVSLQPLTGMPHADKRNPRWMPIAAAAIVLAAAGVFAGVYFAMKSKAQVPQQVSSTAPESRPAPVPQASRSTTATSARAPVPAAQPAAIAAPVAETTAATSAPPATPPATRAGTSDSVKSLYQRKGMSSEQAMAQSAAEAAQAAAPLSGSPVTGDAVRGAGSVQTFASDETATVRTQDVAQQKPAEPAVAKSTVNQKALDAEIARQVAQQREAELAARVQSELEQMQAQDAALEAKRAQAQPRPKPKPEPRAEPAPAADPDASVPLATQLADDVQKRIPNIDFGAHVYAGRTNAGFVILNGKKRYPGDIVAPGLTVERITESGVILDLNGTRFRLNSMSSWIN